MLKTQKQKDCNNTAPHQRTNQYRQTITLRVVVDESLSNRATWRQRVLESTACVPLCACMSVFSLCCVSICELAPLCVGQQLRTGEHRKTKVLAPKFWRFTWSWISQTSGQSVGSKTASHRSPNKKKTHTRNTTETKQNQDGQCTRS